MRGSGPKVLGLNFSRQALGGRKAATPTSWNDLLKRRILARQR